MVHGALFAHEPIIIPTPQSVVLGEGCYTISPTTTISTSYAELQPLVDYCAAEIDLVKSAKQGDVELVIDSNLANEEYYLNISANGIQILGGNYGGVFNGVMTLMQL